MSTPSHKSGSVRTKIKLLFKVRGATIASLVILTVSTLFMAYHTTRVVTAMDRWVHLREVESSSSAIEEALESLNNEEAMLITPIGLTLMSLVVAFHSVKLKIIPKKCFYCGKWAQARKVKQTPDKIFYYHEKCKVNRKLSGDR